MQAATQVEVLVEVTASGAPAPGPANPTLALTGAALDLLLAAGLLLVLLGLIFAAGARIRSGRNPHVP